MACDGVIKATYKRIQFRFSCSSLEN